MNWRIKGLVQKVLSITPGGVYINECLQRTFGGRRNFDAHIATKFERDWLVMIDHMRGLGISPKGRRFFEIGTGWFPVFPTCFALSGAASCVTFDLTCHLAVRGVQRMLQGMVVHLPAIAEVSQRTVSELQVEHGQLLAETTLEGFLRRARIEYHAPADASASDLAEESVDVVFSNSVLEHVSQECIVPIFRESHRVLRSTGYAIHSINCGDHYAYWDRNITPINYLAYDAKSWRFWNNRIQFQNRLRPQDFLEMTECAGFELISVKQTPKQRLMTMLDQLSIAEEFRRYSAEQLCTTSVDFVARKR
jgi:hypothetical protein